MGRPEEIVLGRSVGPNPALLLFSALGYLLSGGSRQQVVTKVEPLPSGDTRIWVVGDAPARLGVTLRELPP